MLFIFSHYAPLSSFWLCGTGVDLLSSIAGPVALISISGPYRTGKSFLLNELSKRAVAANLSVVRIGAAGDRDGPITFPVGDAVWPVTQGLQIEILGKFGDTTICIVGAYPPVLLSPPFGRMT